MGRGVFCLYDANNSERVDIAAPAADLSVTTVVVPAC
jgi:hypothetical protein